MLLRWQHCTMFKCIVSIGIKAVLHVCRLIYNTTHPHPISALPATDTVGWIIVMIKLSEFVDRLGTPSSAGSHTVKLIYPSIQISSYILPAPLHRSINIVQSLDQNNNLTRSDFFIDLCFCWSVETSRAFLRIFCLEI
jgi:hypothetical protein